MTGKCSRNYLFSIILLLIFLLFLSVIPVTGAEGKDEPGSFEEIRDVITLPQNPFFYLSGDYNKRLISEEDQLDHVEEFRDLFFSPWDQSSPRHGMDVQDWIFEHFGKKQGYGENLRQRSPEWLTRQKDNANLHAFGTLNSRAISVRPTDLRLLPTSRPFFHDPTLAGEGFPFDYLQNSGVHGGEPLFISHLSKDGAWAWSETSYAAGWIKLEDLAFVSEEFLDKWRSQTLGVFIADQTPLLNKKGIFRFMGNTGTILPIKSRGITANRILLPVRAPDGNSIAEETVIDREHFQVHPLPFTAWNTALVCERVMNTPYGWGGYLENRDCSATIRDIFLPFGIWLPRNSAAQARSGITLSLEGLDNDDKVHGILREGIPFLTLVHKRGHVMLYLGQYRGRPVILHNTWGIRTLTKGKESRHIIGKTVITTLEPGKELADLYPGNSLLIDSITSLTLLGGIK